MDPVKVKARLASWKWLVLLAVGLLFLGWLLNTPEGLLGKADAIGYAVCHRIDARSFHLGDRAVPLCARCSGMYLGSMLGLAYLSLTGWRKGGMPPKRVIAILVFFVLAFGFDGLNSYLSLFPGFPTLYQPNNTLRMVTGTGMGLVIAIAMYPAFNQTVWKDWVREPAMPGLRALFLLILCAAALVGAVLTENPLVLYPLALISASGVLVLLTMVYSMVWLMIFRSENRFTRLGQMWLPLVGGFGLALVQIGLLDLARFILTGTWDGFHIG